MTTTILPKQEYFDQLILPIKCKVLDNMIVDDNNNNMTMMIGHHNKLSNISINGPINDADTGNAANGELSIKPKRKRQRLDHLTQEQKVMRRKLKNRMAAQSARDRKKKKMIDLEKENSRLNKEKCELLKHNRYLEQKLKLFMEENDSLRKRLGIEPIKLESCDDTLELLSSINNNSSGDHEIHNQYSIDDNTNSVNYDDDDYVNDGSDEDNSSNSNSSDNDYSSIKTMINAFESAEGTSIDRKRWKNNKRFELETKKRNQITTTTAIKSSSKDLFTAAIDQLFNDFTDENFVDDHDNKCGQLFAKQSIQYIDENRIADQFNFESKNESQSLSNDANDTKSMFIENIETTMPHQQFTDATISTNKTSSLTELIKTIDDTDYDNANINNQSVSIIDHDYAIIPTTTTLMINSKDEQPSLNASLSDMGDIGYESMSSPEPSTPIINNEQQSNMILNDENLNLNSNDLLFPIVTNKQNNVDHLNNQSIDLDFISDDNLQPSLDELMKYEPELYDLFSELF